MKNSYSSGAPGFPAGEQTYTYNALNQLKTYSNGTESASYMYYGDGLRATKTVSGTLTRYVYLNGRVIEELDANGNRKARNVWGNELIFRHDQERNQSGYYYYNGHGDVIEIKDAQGNRLNSYAYDIWGNVKQKTEGMRNPFRYTGEIQDDESGLIYLRARYYDPSMGRFISQDTYEGKLDHPLSLNLYTYVENNPLRYTDPTGHRVWLIHGTFSDGDTWTPDFENYVEGLFNESSDKLEWSGKNNKDARLEAAEKSVKQVQEWHKENPNDPIRLVGHSHGGNVAIMLANLLAEKGMKVETLITIATPVREYKLETEVGRHIQMYNNRDIVQMDMAGYDSGWNIFKLGIGSTVTRKFKSAENVRATDAEKKGTKTQAHSAMHSNVEIWEKYIEPLLKR